MRLRLLLLSLFLAAAPAAAQVLPRPAVNIPASKVRVSGLTCTDLQCALDNGEVYRSPYDACRAGARGGGLDPTTGLYAWTCANYNFARILDPTLFDAAYSVTCTAAATPDASCLRAGETRLVNVLHTTGVATDYTAPGGTVYWPVFSGKDHGIYVDRGCGVKSGGARNNCPEAALLGLAARMGATKWAQRGPHARRFSMQAERGIQHKAEAPGTVTFEAGVPILRGVWYIADRGQNASTGHETDDGPSSTLDPAINIMTVGSQSWATAWCDDTSSTNPRCLTTANSHAFDMPGVFSYGVQAQLLAMTPGPGVQPSLCIDNRVSGQNETTTTGTCPGDRLTRCWATGATTLRSSGGCCWDLNASGTCNAGDYDVSEGVGCQGFVDAISYDGLTLGRKNDLMVEIANYTDGASVAADTSVNMGSREVWLSVSSIGGTCATNGKLLFPGGGISQNTETPFGYFTDPWPRGYTVQSSDFVRAYDPGAWAVPEEGFDGISFMPSDWLGRTGRCTVLTSANCDSLLIGLDFGDQLFYRNAVFLYGVESSGTAGGINGSPGTRSVDFSHNSILEWKSGAAMDMGTGWKFHHNLVYGTDTLLSTFTDNWEVSDNTFFANGGGVVGTLWKVGLVGPQRDFLFTRNVFNSYQTAGTSALEIGTVSRGRIEDNVFSGVLGPVIRVIPHVSSGATTTRAYVHGLSILRNRFEGWDIGATVINQANAPIFFDKNTADGRTDATRDLSGIVIAQNTSRGNNSNACLVWFQNDRDAAALMDETRPNVTITGNESYGTTPQTVCLGNTSGAFGTRLTTWPNTGSFPRFEPLYDQNMVNGLADFGYPWSQKDSQQVPDCQLLPKGYEVTINDDITLSGTCGDVGADGQLDGGGTFVSTCICNPAGSGVWSAK